MLTRMNQNLFRSRSFRVGFAFVLFALIIGVYFLFRPFPAGPSLDVKANVPEAASIIGWSAYANPPTVEKVNASAVQRLDIGAGYVLETNALGSKIVAPSASLLAARSASSAVQRVDIGSGYVLENSAQGGRIVAPLSAPLEAQSASTDASVQRLDIGAGYVLENGSQETRIVPPSALQKVTDNASHSKADMRIDIGGGYILVLDLKGNGAIVPAR